MVWHLCQLERPFSGLIQADHKGLRTRGPSVVTSNVCLKDEEVERWGFFDVSPKVQRPAVRSSTAQSRELIEVPTQEERIYSASTFLSHYGPSWFGGNLPHLVGVGVLYSVY